MLLVVRGETPINYYKCGQILQNLCPFNTLTTKFYIPKLAKKFDELLKLKILD